MVLIQSRVYIILVQDHKSSFSQSIATRVLPVIVLLPCQDLLSSPQWCLIPFVCPSPALSPSRRRVAWARWWCPTSCPPPCVACPLSQPSPTPPLASPVALLPQTGPPAFPPKSQSQHPCAAYFIYLSILSRHCLLLKWILFSLFGKKSAPSVHLILYLLHSQTVPCCPVPAIAGRLFCPAQMKTIGLLERTERSGMWANPRTSLRGSQMEMR